MGVEFLGEIPLELDDPRAGRAGTPIVAAHPDRGGAGLPRIAARIWEKLEGAGRGDRASWWRSKGGGAGEGGGGGGAGPGGHGREEGGGEAEQPVRLRRTGIAAPGRVQARAAAARRAHRRRQREPAVEGGRQHAEAGIAGAGGVDRRTGKAAARRGPLGGHRRPRLPQRDRHAMPSAPCSAAGVGGAPSVRRGRRPRARSRPAGRARAAPRPQRRGRGEVEHDAGAARPGRGGSAPGSRRPGPPSAAAGWCRGQRASGTWSWRAARLAPLATAIWLRPPGRRRSPPRRWASARWRAATGPPRLRAAASATSAIGVAADGADEGHRRAVPAAATAWLAPLPPGSRHRPARARYGPGAAAPAAAKIRSG